MKKEFWIYSLFVFFIFVCAVIIFPHAWINLDIGSFHYHKLWRGPDLADLTSGKYKYDFNLKLGREFKEGSIYKLAVVFNSEGSSSAGAGQDFSINPEQVEGSDKEKLVNETVNLLRNRIQMLGYYESRIYYEKNGDEYFIIADLPLPKEELEDYKTVLTEKGIIEIWGEKSEEEQSSADTSEVYTGLRQLMASQYKNLEVPMESIKGGRILYENDSYALRLALQPNSSVELTTKIFSYFGKRLLVLIDDSIFALNGADLSNQLQYYRKIDKISVLGMKDKQTALMYFSAIRNGPLPVNLEIIESSNTNGLFTNITRSNLIVLGIASIGLMAAASIILIKKNSICSLISFVIFILLFTAGLKIIHITITSSVLITIILIVGIFYSFILFLLKSTFIIKKGSDEFIERIVNNYVLINIIIGLVVNILGLNGYSLIGKVLIINAFVGLFVVKIVLPYLYRFPVIIKSKV